MALTSTKFYRPSSPTISLPMSHSELMETYKGFVSLSPKIKTRTYKRDAAGLIISWLKSILKKRLWTWRLNCTKLKRTKVNLNLKVKKPGVFIERRVYLQVMREKNYLNQKLKEFNSSKSPRPEIKIQETSGRLKLREKIAKKKTWTREEAKIKCEAIQALGKKIKVLIDYRYLDCFLLMLIHARRFWVGKKLVGTCRVIVKARFLDFFQVLKPKTLINSLSTFKVFVSKPERSITCEGHLSLSPSPRKTDTNAETTEKKLSPFECCPEISKCDLSSVNSSLSVIEFDIRSKKNTSPKSQEILKYLEANFENIKKIVRKSERKTEKQHIPSKNPDSKSLSLRKSYENQKQNLVKLLASILKAHVTIIQKSSIDLLKAHAGSQKKIELQRKTKKIRSFTLMLSTKNSELKKSIFEELKERTAEIKFFESSLSIAIEHRNNYLCIQCFSQWKDLEKNNKKLCRAFELLGRFVNSKKISVFKLVKIPKPLSYYSTREYQIPLSITKRMYYKAKTRISLVFKKWKISKILSIKLVRFIAIMKKSVFINSATTWQTLLAYTALSN